MDREERKRREKEELVRKRRRQILDAAVELFSRKRPDGVSMNAIASRCGLSKGTIYLYYASKEDLLFHIMLNYLKGMRRRFRADKTLSGRENLEGYVEFIKDLYHNDRNMKLLAANFDFYYLDGYPGDLPAAEEYVDYISSSCSDLEEIFQRGIRDGTLRSDLDIPLVSRMISNLGGTFGSRTSLRRNLMIREQGSDPYEQYCALLDLILQSALP